MKRSWRIGTRIAAISALAFPFVLAAGPTESPFATRVLEYRPAPGQFVNDGNFNDPIRALGPPVGAGLFEPSNESVVSLGGFGGFIVLGFDHTVEDDPLNPMGLDAIIFGNAFFVGGNPNRRWSECATVEISLDENRNGVADDAWYLIPGSHLPPPERYLAYVVWDDDLADGIYPPSEASWIPEGRDGVWATSAYTLRDALFAAVIVINPSPSPDREGIHGYADHSPTVVLGDFDADGLVDDSSIAPEEFYIRPDDPFEVGISAGSCGGDALDIAWAVDAATGEPANLPGFDFIRITTANATVSIAFGEKSAEIDAVSDVPRDPYGNRDKDDDIDLYDAAGFLNCLGWEGGPVGGEECGGFDRDGDSVIDDTDFRAFVGSLQGPR